MSKSPVRVLVFLPFLTLGGAERQGLLVARYLKDRGHNVEVWGFPPPRGKSTLLPELRHHGLRYEELSSSPKLNWHFPPSARPVAYFTQYCQWLKSLRSIAANLPGRKFDVIIPFTFTPSLIACLLREKLGAGKCYWNHRGGDDAAGVQYTPFLVKQVLHHHPRFVANSRAGAKFLQDKFDLSSSQVTVIPNAYVADIEGSKAELAAMNSQSCELSLIQVANFFPEKDYDTVLRALQLLRSQGTLCRLHFCGEFLFDSDRFEFAERVRELGIQDCVVYHGATTRPEVYRLLLAADIGLLSSKSEGQPNCIMEYMAIGLPVVATKISGNQEIVGEENEQYLFEVGDAGRLAWLINGLKENPALRAEIGRRNRRRIIEHFGADQVFPRWAALVERD